MPDLPSTPTLPSEPTITTSSPPPPPSPAIAVATEGPIPVVTVPASNSPPPKHLHTYLLTLVFFLLGVGLGLGLVKTFPFSTSSKDSVQEKKSITLTLPPDAVPIQGCSTGRGMLYIRPEDIPVGPVYMVNKGNVIGIEFMLAKEEFLTGKSYKNLQGLGMSIDHVNVGLLSEGHEGYRVPHYHVDVYAVPKSEEEGIQCSKTASPTAIIEATESSEPAVLMEKESVTSAPARKPTITN